MILMAFAAGTLDEAGAEAVVAHLEGCPACCEKAASLPGDSFLNRLRAVQSLSATAIPNKGLPPAEPPTRAADPDHTTPPQRGSMQAPRGADSCPSAWPTTAAPAGRLGGVSTNTMDLPAELRNHPSYEVLKELGRGGMGVVYLARNKLLDRHEVLKVVNRKLLGDPEAAERFLREMRSAARLGHKNIVTAYAALQVGEVLLFAMEYVEGEDLAQVVKARGPLPVVNACYYAQQAAQGLQHAHEAGLVHRDIKPQNLILARHGKRHVVKILDFGLAKATREEVGTAHDLTGTGVMLGTPQYMAPEQTQDAAAADIRADLYSLGCTLYFLLTGGPPFSMKNLYDVLHAHKALAATPLDQVRQDVPAELAALVAKMMAKEPSQRYQSPAEVVQGLMPFVKPGARSGHVPPLPPQLSGVNSPGKETMMPGDISRLKFFPAEAGAPARVVPAAESPFADLDRTAITALKASPAPAGGGRQKRSVWPWLVGGAGAAAVVLLGIILVIRFSSTTEVRLETTTVAQAEDLLQRGSVWRGVGQYTFRGQPKVQPAGKFSCTLTITERKGDEFRGIYAFEDGSSIASTIEGTLAEARHAASTRKIRWQHIHDLKGDACRDVSTVEGTLVGAVLKVNFSHRDRNSGRQVGAGVIEFQTEKGAASALAGVWDGTFTTGETWAFIISSNDRMYGSNGFRGHCSQKGRKVILIDEGARLAPGYGRKWEGEIDPTGKTMKLTNELNGVTGTFVRRSSPDATPPIFGTWDGTFSRGETWIFKISSDGVMTGTNDFRGHYGQTGRKVILIDEAAKLAPGYGRKWEGEIDSTGKTMKLTNELNGVVGTFVRR
jgi:serine/threonine protein kinase